MQLKPRDSVFTEKLWTWVCDQLKTNYWSGITFKKRHLCSITRRLEPTIQSCDTGQRIAFFDSCQLTIIWMFTIKFSSKTDCIYLRHLASSVRSLQEKMHSYYYKSSLSSQSEGAYYCSHIIKWFLTLVCSHSNFSDFCCKQLIIKTNSSLFDFIYVWTNTKRNMLPCLPHMVRSFNMSWQ